MTIESNQDSILKKTWPLWVGIFALGLFMVFFRIGSDALWYDESYSIAAAEHPVLKMIPMIGMDSHPPLYFIILRGFMLVFGNSLTAVRAVSALGIVGLALLGFFPLRRIAGEKIGLAFSLIIFLTPMSIVSAHEARMYSWAACFVTAMLLWGYLAITKKRKRDWLLLGVFTLCAAYTHYFALIAAGMFWSILLVWLIVKKDKPGLLLWLITAALVLALFSPWFIFLIKQASRVKKNYWIPPVTFGMVLRVLSYPFSQKFKWVPEAGPVLLFLATFISGIAGILITVREKHTRWFIPFSGLLVFSLTLLASLILSKVFRPILMERYMISCMGVFLLGFAFFIGKWEKVWITPVLLAFYLLLELSTLVNIYKTEINGPMDLVYMDLKDKVKPEDIFVHGSEHNLGTFSYYFPDNKHYLYIPKDFVPFSNYEVFSHRGDYGNDYLKYSKEPVTIWVTNRAGEYYSMPFSLIGKAPYRRLTGTVSRYSKAPGWYSVSVQKVEYDSMKTMTDPDKDIAGTGNLHVRIMDMQEKLGGALLIALYDKDPISPTNFIQADMREVKGPIEEFVFKDLKYGDYAVFAFHDINNNQEPDFKDSKPLEGMALSLNESYSGGGIDFYSLEFSFTDDKTWKEIRMIYEK